MTSSSFAFFAAGSIRSDSPFSSSVCAPWTRRSSTASAIVGLRSYGTERVEAACQRGIDIGARTYSSVASILRDNLDRPYRIATAKTPSANANDPSALPRSREPDGPSRYSAAA